MKIVTTKLEAAERQLREAIRLWFVDGDPVAIHSLACSAHQVIHDLNSRRGGGDLLYDSLVIKDEFRSEWIALLKNPYNFLKHGLRDADGSVEIHTEVTQIFLLFSILGLKHLGQKQDPTQRAYLLYFAITQPHILKEDSKEIFRPFLHEWSSIAAEKSEFFRMYTDAHRVSD